LKYIRHEEEKKNLLSGKKREYEKQRCEVEKLYTAKEIK
jgi:hypothetical protein